MMISSLVRPVAFVIMFLIFEVLLVIVENNIDPSAFYYIAINDELDSK